MHWFLQKIIRFYQVAISPYLGRNCRFYPSCSNYALKALERYGVWRGLLKTIGRICRCHPWNPGGVDPP